MRFSEIFTLVACLAAGAMADTDAVTPDASPDVYACEHSHFYGQCRHFGAPSGVCQNVASDFSHRISAVQPNTAAGLCYFHDDYNCQGNSFYSTYPGVADVPNLYPAFNDRIVSFKCTAI
ncbi:hypothetical protein HDV62DRAFT_397696 [Trichoderma sp. SZMC 28011]